MVINSQNKFPIIMDIKDVIKSAPLPAQAGDQPSSSTASSLTAPPPTTVVATAASYDNEGDQDEFGLNPKGALNEQCQRAGVRLTYTDTIISLNASTGAMFGAVALLADTAFTIGYGRTKKAAQRAACVHTLRAVKHNAALFPVGTVTPSTSKTGKKRSSADMGADSTTDADMDVCDIPLDARTTELLSVSHKTAVSLITEISQKRKLATPSFEVRASTDGGINGDFIAKLVFADFDFPETFGRSKKVAKERAALTALDMLVRTGQMTGLNETKLPAKRILAKPIDPHKAQTVYELIASAVDTMVYNECKTHPLVAATAKVIAGIVATDDMTGNAWVLAWGTGTRSLNGAQMRTDGSSVCDSHAEILARRGFVRFLYSQLSDVLAGKETLFDAKRGADNRLVLKPHIHIHLYIDTAPCGDGRVFTLAENRQSMAISETSMSTMTQHVPIMPDPDKHGLMRSKIEMGEGTIPTKECADVQTLDGITGGERLRTMSCSDKLMRWNVLGMQGTLLSLFVQPIYMRSLVIGTLCHHGHMSRAVCCRVQAINEQLVAAGAAFKAHASSVRQRPNTTRDTGKSSLFSANWNFIDQTVELIDGGSGRVDVHPYTSRLCKKSMYAEYKQLCAKLGQPNWVSRTYGETKNNVVAYERAKKLLYDYVKAQKFGHWMGKPREEKLFK